MIYTTWKARSGGLCVRNHTEFVNVSNSWVSTRGIERCSGFDTSTALREERSTRKLGGNTNRWLTSTSFEKVPGLVHGSALVCCSISDSGPGHAKFHKNCMTVNARYWQIMFETNSCFRSAPCGTRDHLDASLYAICSPLLHASTGVLLSRCRRMV